MRGATDESGDPLGRDSNDEPQSQQAVGDSSHRRAPVRPNVDDNVSVGCWTSRSYTESSRVDRHHLATHNRPFVMSDEALEFADGKPRCAPWRSQRRGEIDRGHRIASAAERTSPMSIRSMAATTGSTKRS